MSHQTLLVTLSGIDRPGVTRRLFEELGRFDVRIDDIEQFVVQKRLVLSVLLGLDHDEHDDADAMRQLSAAATKIGEVLELEVTTQHGATESTTRRANRVEITVMGSPLRPAALVEIAGAIAERGANIDRIRRIARYPVTAIVLEVSGADPIELRRALSELSAVIGADIAVQAAGLDRRGQHLVVMDVDSTVIQDEVIDLLADEAGVMAEVALITERAMAGELDFSESLRARVALLAGLPESALQRVRERITLTPGARTLCRTLNRLGYRICLVSGGFIEVVAPLAQELGVSAVRANALEVVDGVLTGNVVGEIVDRKGKRRALEAFATEFGVPMTRTIAIGDGANDIDMLEAAGLGVAFNAKPAARAAADTAVNVPYLDTVLYLLGITREEVEAADAAAGYVSSAPPIE